jgi:hypothetical protein
MNEEPDNLTLQDLYPDLTPEQQAEAERNLKAYMQMVGAIYSRRFRVSDTKIFNQAIDAFLPEDKE